MKNNPLLRLWNFFQTVQAPVADQIVAPPQVPGLRQDQFPAGPAQIAACHQEDEKLTTLYMRVVRSNNAFVTRDYGRGPVVIHCDSRVPDLTAAEIERLGGKRAGVKFIEQPERLDLGGLVDPILLESA